MIQYNDNGIRIGNDAVYQLTLDKTGKKSFGICIVRGEVKDSPNTKTTGIFIKGVVPDSPAYLCGKLKIGDRILSINKRDVRNATEQDVIELIKEAGIKIVLEIQTFEKEEKRKCDINMENGLVLNRTRMTPSVQSIKYKPPNVNSMLKNTSIVRQNTLKTINSTNYHDDDNDDDDDEDTREMTGRMRTEAGYEIDRASAGNCKLNKMEKEREKEIEDQFGYTMAKIKKRYNLMKDLRKVVVNRMANRSLGLALAGHSDRQRMACFIAGIHPNGQFAGLDIKPGDEIIEVNGTVLQNRCHLNASTIFKNIDCETIALVTSRRKTTDDMSVQPLKYFPPEIDDTKFLFEQYPKARSVAVKKDGGFLGIMVIYGKHAEIGNGIFISDLREDSNAMLAGIKVGDLLLAVNKDVTLESTYDEVVAILKRAEGIVNLVVMSLKKDEDLKKTEHMSEEENAKEKAAKEPEKPKDPATCLIDPNQKTLIEIKADKKPLGAIVVGGKNNYVKTGCVITHIYPEGILAKDNRLKIYDQIIEVNNIQVACSVMTTLKVHQLFHTAYEKVNFLVYRAEPPELETFKIEFMKKPGKELGLSLAPNDKGCTISDIACAGYADIDNKLQRGDIITKFNGDSLDGCTFEMCYALFKAANGRITLDITRPKPTERTEPIKP